ncbi:MAG: hypothetical protein KAJ91_01510 [Candidatus Aenigmarchaeota archaeon]|nr:hypothetical protein [Candidatus Aenigmarchaeota archaeon]
MKKIFVIAMILLFLPLVQAIEVSEHEPISIHVGHTGLIKATIIETNEYASFGIYATCTDGFSQVGGTIVGTGSQTTSIPIVCSGEETSGTCTINVYDSNKPQDKDSMSVPVECILPRLCNPGERRCNGNNIEFCNEDGSGWGTYKTCENDCEYNNFEPGCKINETEFDPTIVIFAVFVIVILIVAFYWKRNQSKNSGKP